MFEGIFCSSRNPSHNKDPFSRIDENDDAIFYSKERLVPHLDSLAQETIVDLIEKLVVEDNPIILDLMASWDSHIPFRLRRCRITGLGMNENELKNNEVLSDYIVHDLTFSL